MKVVVPAVQHKITSSTSSTLVSTGDKKDMYLSMWNEALSDKVWYRSMIIVHCCISIIMIQVPKQGPISARLQQELSPTFSKFISAKANMILSRGLQMEVDTESRITTLYMFDFRHVITLQAFCRIG